jgi:hypothetical protein
MGDRPTGNRWRIVVAMSSCPPAERRNRGYHAGRYERPAGARSLADLWLLGRPLRNDLPTEAFRRHHEGRETADCSAGGLSSHLPTYTCPLSLTV